MQKNTLRANSVLLNSTETIIWEASEKYNVDYDILYYLAICESGLKQNRYGDSGLAYGIYQWHQSSWTLYNKKFGTDLDRNGIEDQITMTAKVLAEKGYKNWANCFKQQVLGNLIK